MKYIGKLLPVDGYSVSLNDNLPLDYTQSLTHLYQPLIGNYAVILYITLYHQVDMQSHIGIQTHHTLMNYLNLPLDDVYKARLNLEGIGLLNTYESEENDNMFYIYELKSPFSPKSFFEDAMLSHLLFHNIGETKYRELKEYYTPNHSYKKLKNITASFNEVFDSHLSSSDDVESIVPHQQETGPIIEQIDFTWIEHMLKQRLIPVKKVLNSKNKQVIQQMMLVYDFTSYDIENILLWSLNDENELNLEEFKEACYHLSISQNKQPAKIGTDKNSKVKVTSTDESVLKQPKTKKEAFIHELETISPNQLLADHSQGHRASKQDMKDIREIMETQGIPSPVMNVLIHYVLLQSNKKLSKGYVEKIASHWSRANLKTVEEAMEFAKEEKRQREESIQRKSQPRRYNQKNNKEVIPDWFKERKTNRENNSTEQEQLNEQDEKEALDKLIKQYENDNLNQG